MSDCRFEVWSAARRASDCRFKASVGGRGANYCTFEAWSAAPRVSDCRFKASSEARRANDCRFKPWSVGFDRVIADLRLCRQAASEGLQI